MRYGQQQSRMWNVDQAASRLTALVKSPESALVGPTEPLVPYESGPLEGRPRGALTERPRGGQNGTRTEGPRDVSGGMTSGKTVPLVILGAEIGLILAKIL